jgi:hypothetical protein
VPGDPRESKKTWWKSIDLRRIVIGANHKNMIVHPLRRLCAKAKFALICAYGGISVKID